MSSDLDGGECTINGYMLHGEKEIAGKSGFFIMEIKRSAEFLIVGFFENRDFPSFQVILVTVLTVQ